MTDNQDYDQEMPSGAEPVSRRRRAIEAYGSARENAGRRATEALEEAPLAILAGGLAAGALLAALLPRTRTEERMLRPVTDRARDMGRAAARAAKDAGQSRLDDLGLTRDRGSEAIRSIFQGATDAAKASAQAAIGTVRNA